MRIAVVSHSLVAERQAIFWNHFALQKDVTLLQVYPRRWGDLTREGGYNIGGNNMFTFLWTRDARKGLAEFEPELVYIQEEVYAWSTRQVIGWSQCLLKPPKVGVFVWENLRKGDVYLYTPEDIDFIIAGNNMAGEIHKTRLVMPQVGIDFDLFKPSRSEKSHDMIFASRKVNSKGWDIVQHLPFTLRATQAQSYFDMPLIYNSGRVHVVLSSDEPNWHEQFLPYSNVEALACGLRCVVGRVPATVEWGTGCPGLRFVPSRDKTIVTEAVASSLKDWKPNLEGREWAQQRFSLDVVALGLKKIFQEELAKP